MVTAEQLIKLLDFNLSSKNFDNAVKLLDEQEYAKVILSHYPEVIQEVLLKHLTADNYVNEPSLYEACEGILKLLAEKCHQEGILFEFIEIIESVKDDDIFTSVLKCLQVIVLNQSEKKSRALEYCLNSIEDYVHELPLPTELLKNVEEEEEKVLENDDQIRRVLMMYLTLELFYKPVVKQIVEDTPTDKTFRSNYFNRRNVLFCFVLKMLGKPLSVLDLSHEDDTKVKTYSRQVAENMVTTLCKLHTDVFRLLHYVELRSRWPSKQKIDDDLVDIFLHHEKAPMIQLGMLFYLVIAEEIGIEMIPRIYNPVYIFETVIYLVNVMITSDNAVIFKGLKLCLKTLDNIDGNNLSSDQLDLEIHREFCGNLVQLLMYSPSKRNRQNGLKVLRSYILKFDFQGRYLLLKNMLRISEHKGLLGYLTTLYKDMIFEELNAGKVSEFTSGSNLKALLMNHICNLTGGAQCDIADSSDQINSSLNFLMALLLRDKENATSIKDLVPQLEKEFLGELRSALDMSRAHYYAEIENVKSGKSIDINEMLKDTEILNYDEPLTDLTSQKKLEMLYSALSMFDLIDYQLARVNEIINRTM
jgi:glomulin